MLYKVTITWWVILCIYIATVTAQNSTDTQPVNWWDTDYPKAVITLGVLAGAFILGIGVAKLAEWCYKRNSIRDDASDISEHTKELLRKQLVLMSMRRIRKTKKKKPEGDIEASESEPAKLAFNKWATKIKRPNSKQAVVNNNAKEVSDNNSRPRTRISFTDEHKRYNDAKQQWEEIDIITADIPPVTIAIINTDPPVANGSAVKDTGQKGDNTAKKPNSPVKRSTSPTKTPNSPTKRSDSPQKRSNSPTKRTSSPTKSNLKSVPEQRKGSLTSEDFEFIDETIKALDDKNTNTKTDLKGDKSRTPSPTKAVSPTKVDIPDTIKSSSVKPGTSNTEPLELRPKTPLNKIIGESDNKNSESSKDNASAAYSRYNETEKDNKPTVAQVKTPVVNQPQGKGQPVKGQTPRPTTGKTPPQRPTTGKGQSPRPTTGKGIASNQGAASPRPTTGKAQNNPVRPTTGKATNTASKSATTGNVVTKQPTKTVSTDMAKTAS